jgi:hypothetical protein
MEKHSPLCGRNKTCKLAGVSPRIGIPTLKNKKSGNLTFRPGGREGREAEDKIFNRHEMKKAE